MKRVLIVDDEPSYREYLMRFLSRQGYEVRTAAGGREALAVGEEFEPDVVLADWMLEAEVHGLQVGETLRARNPSLRILLMTGLPAPEIREEAVRAGVDRFLEKPFGLQDVADAIAAALATTEPG